MSSFSKLLLTLAVGGFIIGFTLPQPLHWLNGLVLLFWGIIFGHEFTRFQYESLATKFDELLGAMICHVDPAAPVLDDPDCWESMIKKASYLCEKLSN